MHHPTRGDLHIVKPAIILLRGKLDDRIVGCIRLYNCLPLLLTASGTTDHLRQQRESGFIAAVIVAVQRLIRRQHAYQSHLRKVKTLRHHLRADHDAVFPIGERSELLLIRLARGGGIGIHPQDRHVGEQLLKLLLDELRADTGILQLIRSALRTGRRRRLRMAAIVTHQTMIRPMIGHRYTARRAGQRLTAGAAGQMGMEPASVEQQNHLLAVVEALLHPLTQHPADRSAGERILAQIRDLDLRQTHLTESAGQLHQRVATADRRVIALHRRCRGGQ